MKVLRVGLIALHVLGFAPEAIWARSVRGSLPRQRRDDTSSTPTSPPAADSTICGDIIGYVNEGYWYQWASDAYECLMSVPFHAAVALRFLDYFNTTIQFQSTLAYLRNPPTGYQQPAIDVEKALQDITTNVRADQYQNQYEFEADVMRLVYAMHDSHVYLYAGAMSAFTFGSGVSLVSASLDGIQPPKIYYLDDVFEYRNSEYTYNISAIDKISGRDAVSWLKEFAANNSVGTVEPHADWNQAFYSPVQEILQTYDLFNDGATFYPGDELTISFENGTDSLEGNWLAVYTGTSYTGPLTTGGDFYNYFVLGLLPDNYDNLPLPDVFNVTYDDSGATIPPLSDWYNATYGSYPDNPVVVQSNLSVGVTGGVVTGYILDDISTGVLSIPSFDETGYTIGGFAQAVSDFVNITQTKNVKRILIDLQGNQGGQALLAFTTFGSFFPNIMPFAGSRRRSHHLADVVGNATSQYWADLPRRNENKTVLEGDEWMILDRINAETSRNFSSWSQYYGPRSENGGFFSLVEQYDFSNINFQAQAFDSWYTDLYIDGADKSLIPPYKAEEIVILTDGQCASACSIFLEMMTHQAGVRTVVVGGLPETGPMQAASGTRGAAVYYDDQLDEDFSNSNYYSDGRTVSELPPLNPDTETRDTGMLVTYFSFNLRDQVRAPKESAVTPLQFSYLAADCRIYFTLHNILNVTQLWHDAATATWIDSSRCVAKSTGYSSTSSDKKVLPPPVQSAAEVEFPVSSGHASDSLLNQSSNAELDDGIWAGPSKTPRSNVHLCGDGHPSCSLPYHCVSVTYSCSQGDSKLVTNQICMPKCDSIEKQCSGGNMYCDTSSAVAALEERASVGLSTLTREGGHAGRPKVRNPNNKIGQCKPSYGSYFPGIGCPTGNGAVGVGSNTS